MELRLVIAGIKFTSCEGVQLVYKNIRHHDEDNRSCQVSKVTVSQNELIFIKLIFFKTDSILGGCRSTEIND